MPVSLCPPDRYEKAESDFGVVPTGGHEWPYAGRRTGKRTTPGNGKGKLLRIAASQSCYADNAPRSSRGGRVVVTGLRQRVDVASRADYDQGNGKEDCSE